MNRRDPFGRLLASLHAAALDDAIWPATSRLIDEACGATGGSFIVGAGAGDGARVSFAAFYRRGERRQDMERVYFDNYFHRDERVPRLGQLRDGRLVPVANLYSSGELKTSAAWNEALPRCGTQNGLNVRLDGPQGSCVVWAIADPVAGHWETGQIRMIERLLPHIRSFVNVRQALAAAKGIGSSVVHLLDNARFGVIHLDRRGRILEANEQAGDLLGRANGLWQEGGFLNAWWPEDDVRLSRLLAAALPTLGRQAAGGSMLVRHPSAAPRLMLHAHPVTARQMDFGAPDLGALVLIEGLDRSMSLDAGLVGSVLGLTTAESRVAVLLAEGRTVPDIAAVSERAESSIRTHLKRIHRKLGVSRRADLVRLVLSVPEREGGRHRP